MMQKTYKTLKLHFYDYPTSLMEGKCKIKTFAEKHVKTMTA